MVLAFRNRDPIYPYQIISTRLDPSVCQDTLETMPCVILMFSPPHVWPAVWLWMGIETHHSWEFNFSWFMLVPVPSKPPSWVSDPQGSHIPSLDRSGRARHSPGPTPQRLPKTPAFLQLVPGWPNRNLSWKRCVISDRILKNASWHWVQKGCGGSIGINFKHFYNWTLTPVTHRHLQNCWWGISYSGTSNTSPSTP